MSIEDELKKEIALLTTLNQQLTHQLYDYRAAFMKARDREWVGLTDDEVTQAMYRADAIITGPMQFRLAAEIEAKLKEKNT